MIEKAARFGDEQQRARVAWGWLAGREPAAAAREILTAAEEMSPRLRSVAVGLMERLDDAAVPALRDMAASGGQVLAIGRLDRLDDAREHGLHILR